MSEIGFGFLRLPQKEYGSIDYEAVNDLVDMFLSLGGRYFDTAYTYHDGFSEEAIRRCLAERWPRDSFVLSDKLPGYIFKSYKECRACFEEQLRRCGVEYFDIYMLHGINKENYENAVRNGEFRLLRELKSEGLAKSIGFSYHDTPQLLDRILTEQPDVDVVLLQINYLDWDSEVIRAAECYETARRHEKRIMIMEPVKGGTLAKLPEEAEKLLRELRPNDSAARWAMRFAAGLEGVEAVLSGMNELGQIEDNMSPMEPLGKEERDALTRCAEIVRADTPIACTACRYCERGCPKSIPISRYFSLYNELRRKPDDDWKVQPVYDAIAEKSARASECIDCRACQEVCPQQLPIAKYMRDVSAVFDSGN